MPVDIPHETLVALTRLVIDWSSSATQRAVAQTAGVSVDPADVQALYMLGLSGETRIGALARALNQTPPTTSKQLVRLERQGLTTRASDPADSRASLVGLSASGLAVFDALNAVTEERIAEALAEVHDPERFASQLRAFTARLLRATGVHETDPHTAG